VPLLDRIAQKVTMPIAITSDRSAYVLGEQWLGVAKGFRDVVFVAVGTGIGVGFVSDGHLIEGAHGIAGAAGWMTVGNLWKSDYQDRGGWETEAAGPGIARRAAMKSAEDVMRAARTGEPKALKVIEQTIDFLALGVANLISVLNPEIVVLGGGVMQASDLMLEGIRTRALLWTQPIAAKQTKIDQTALGEDAGLLGAAKLAWKKSGLD
jgi:glucokinase